MAKVHPQLLDGSRASNKQEVFTLWMKSLIFNAYGCTVFDSSGRIVYRVDNYNKRCGSPVYIMDATGSDLFTITKKRLSIVGVWEGYKGDKPGFRVARIFEMKKLMGCLKGHSLCKIRVDGVDGIRQPGEYVMESEIGNKLSCKILDNLGRVVAEVKRKMGGSGVVLGEDVLAMVVEPHIDHSLIVGLVVVLGLMHHIL